MGLNNYVHHLGRSLRSQNSKIMYIPWGAHRCWYKHYPCPRRRASWFSLRCFLSPRILATVVAAGLDTSHLSPLEAADAVLGVHNVLELSTTPPTGANPSHGTLMYSCASSTTPECIRWPRPSSCLRLWIDRQGEFWSQKSLSKNSAKFSIF